MRLVHLILVRKLSINVRYCTVCSLRNIYGVNKDFCCIAEALLNITELSYAARLKYNSNTYLHFQFCKTWQVKVA